jgi:hypothetical protein
LLGSRGIEDHNRRRGLDAVVADQLLDVAVDVDAERHHPVGQQGRHLLIAEGDRLEVLAPDAPVGVEVHQDGPALAARALEGAVPVGFPAELGGCVRGDRLLDRGSRGIVLPRAAAARNGGQHADDQPECQSSRQRNLPGHERRRA